MAGLVPFVQLDLPGAGGLPDGRYILREAAAEPEAVLVSELVGARPARGRLRGRKPVSEAAEGEAAAPPVRRITYALPERFEDAKTADRWLDEAAAAGADAVVARAFDPVNRAIGAYRVAAGDAMISEIGREDPLVIRVGYGTGDEVAASRWSEARRLPPPRRHKRRPGTEDIRAPQRMAAILSGRDTPDPWELHALRARLDFDNGRSEEAAAEARAALTGFDASPPPFAANLREEIAGRLAAARKAFAEAAIGDEALADAVDLLSRLQDRRRRPPNE